MIPGEGEPVICTGFLSESNVFLYPAVNSYLYVFTYMTEICGLFLQLNRNLIIKKMMYFTLSLQMKITGFINNERSFNAIFDLKVI